MSKKEKRWRRVYLFLCILIYGMVAPLIIQKAADEANATVKKVTPKQQN
jgi:hypothetical protein